MISPSDMKVFQDSFKELYNKAIDHLMFNLWRDKIDRYTRINTPIINEKEVHFELVHTMIGSLLANQSYTWDDINKLGETKPPEETNTLNGGQ